LLEDGNLMVVDLTGTDEPYWTSDFLSTNTVGPTCRR
jgi:hypothetical protein